AGFGLTFVSDFLISQQLWFRLVGGLFICYLGLRTWLSKPATQAATVSGTGLVGAYTSTLFLTLTNPISILFFAGVFSTLGAAGVRFEAPAAVMLVLGIFLGSALWWLFLSVSVSLARSWFTPPLMQWVNRVSGVIIAGFGAVALLGVC
ncbi:MAG: LysE family transporter, partial [Chloroflexota bacterium]